MEKNNRRDFLKTGALLSGSFLLSPAVGNAQAPENSKSMNDNTDVKHRTLGSGSYAFKGICHWFRLYGNELSPKFCSG